MYEVIRCDSIDEPHDVINKQIISNIRLPFFVTSTGYYREGKLFNCVHHGFSSFCVLLTLEGSGRVTYRNKTKSVGPGDTIFTSNREVTKVECAGQQWRFCFMNIGGTLYEYYENLWNENEFHIISCEDTEECEGLLLKINSNINVPYLENELRINMYITQFLSTLLCSRGIIYQRSYPQWLVDSMNYIHENYASESKISELAARHYMDRTYFSRQFKKYLGKTPKEYQIQCRLEQAACLLQTTDYSLVEIADMTGFASQSFFTKMFKRAYAIVPSESMTSS